MLNVFRFCAVAGVQFKLNNNKKLSPRPGPCRLSRRGWTATGQSDILLKCCHTDFGHSHRDLNVESITS